MTTPPPQPPSEPSLPSDDLPTALPSEVPGSWLGASMRGSQLGAASAAGVSGRPGVSGFPNLANLANLPNLMDDGGPIGDGTRDRLPPPAPTTIGPYRIVRRIGEGGMGAVYLAHLDGETEPRPLALKVMRASAAGGDLLLRFRRERRVLAALDHPNIAKMLDAGETEQGEPYFAMEYVDGQSIDEYCDSRRLTIAERVELFRGVCAAVQHAHRNLVVHRDIKPRNILVTADGRPKLLDFGIAKLISLDAPSGPELPTAPEVRAMTPEYASPEQIRGLPISTASDVYSLGVVLFELLVGRRPYRFATRSMREAERVVCESEISPPSDVVMQPDQRFSVDPDGMLVPLGAPVQPSRAAELRGESLARLRRQLAGDLDTIVLMAMRKEPQRRYPSVEALSEDLCRHLDGRPVSAVPDSTTYRFVKFITRHRAGVAAALATAVILVVASSAFAWQAQVARRERATAIQASIAADRAREEADRQRAEAELQRDRAYRRFEQVRDLSTDFAIGVNEAIERLEGSTPVRMMLVETSVAHLDGLLEDAGSDPELLSRVAHAYQRYGDVLGGRRGGSVADPESALQSYGKARAIRRSLVEREPADPTRLRALAVTELSIAHLLSRRGDFDAGVDGVRAAIASIETILAVRPEDADAQRLLAVALQQQADLLEKSGRYAEADALYDRSVELRAALAETHPDDEQRQRDLSTAMSRQAGVALRRGDVVRAERIYRDQVALRSRFAEAAPDDIRHRRDLMIARRSLGEFLADTGRSDQGVAELRELEPIAARLAEADPTNLRAQQDLALVLDSLGRVLRARGAIDEAVPFMRRAVERARWCIERDPGERLSNEIAAMSSERLATPIYDDATDEAVALQEWSVERWRAAARGGSTGDDAPRGSTDVARALTQLGNMYKESGRVDDARRTLLEAIAEYDAAARTTALPEALAADRSRAVAKLEELDAAPEGATTKP